jgi:hypothetical protein
MKPVWPATLERIRQLLAQRSQAAPLLTAHEIRAILGGSPTLRTVERYMRQIRDRQLMVGHSNESPHDT